MSKQIDPRDRKVKSELRKQGLRIADDGQAGWYVQVWNGENSEQVWATDLLPLTKAEKAYLRRCA